MLILQLALQLPPWPVSRLLPVSFRDMHTTAADDSPVDERAQGGVIGLKLRLRESRNSPADATSLIKWQFRKK